MRRILPLFGLLLLGAQPALGQSWARQLSDQIRALGITISVKTRCGLSNSIGTYDSTNNHICLAKSKIPDKAMLTEVITHEAVHAIQDCLGGGLVSSSERSIGDYLISEHGLSPDAVARQFKQLHTGSIWHTRHILQKTDRRTGEMEFEAYSLENDPARVSQLLTSACS